MFDVPGGSEPSEVVAWDPGEAHFSQRDRSLCPLRGAGHSSGSAAGGVLLHGVASPLYDLFWASACSEQNAATTTRLPALLGSGKRL